MIDYDVDGDLDLFAPSATCRTVFSQRRRKLTVVEDVGLGIRGRVGSVCWMPMGTAILPVVANRKGTRRILRNDASSSSMPTELGLSRRAAKEEGASARARGRRRDGYIDLFVAYGHTTCFATTANDSPTSRPLQVVPTGTSHGAFGDVDRTAGPTLSRAFLGTSRTPDYCSQSRTPVDGG